MRVSHLYVCCAGGTTTTKGIRWTHHLGIHEPSRYLRKHPFNGLAAVEGNRGGGTYATLCGPPSSFDFSLEFAWCWDSYVGSWYVRNLPPTQEWRCWTSSVSFGLGTLLNSLNITFQILTIPTICGLVPIPLLSHFISVRKSLIV